MDFFCLRHPQPDIEAGICYGRKDIPLKPGYTQGLLQNLESPILNQKIVRIYTSPLIRCFEPARLLSQRFDLSLKSVPGLMELDFGQWEGQSFNQLWAQSQEYRDWCSHWQTTAPPGGESLAEMVQRVQNFIDTTPIHESLIITHSGVIRSFYHIFNNTTLDDFFHITPEYGSLTCFENL